MSSDYTLRGLDLQKLFARNPIPDDCIDSAIRASDQFDQAFPGWQLYSRIARGDRLYDRGLAAWAIALARSLARAKTDTGHPFVAKRTRRNDWISQAALDALTFTIKGWFPAPASARAILYEVGDDLFSKLRNGLAHAMRAGFDQYCAEIEYQFLKIRRENWKNNSAIRRNVEKRGYCLAEGVNISPQDFRQGVGCKATRPAKDSDALGMGYARAA